MCYPVCIKQVLYYHINVMAKKARSRSHLEKLLASSMPVFVRITKKPTIPDPPGDVVLAKGDVLMLHRTFIRSIVHAKNELTGREYRLPLQAQQEYELLPENPKLDDREYDGTKKLIDASPLPDFVRVVQAHCSALSEEIQEEGDVIKIEKKEKHKNLGDILIGNVSGSTVHLTRDMTFSKYSTMICPDFIRLSDAVSRGCPQRVRVPDLSKGLEYRDVRNEAVMVLISCSEVEYVLATRLGDLLVLSIPVNTPLSLEEVRADTIPVLHVAGRGTSLLDAFTTLYPRVNPTIDMLDPTHGYLSKAMRAIPEPIDSVLKTWIADGEGKHRSRAETIAYRRDTEAKIRSMAAEIDQLRSRLGSNQTPDPESLGDNDDVESSHARSPPLQSGMRNESTSSLNLVSPTTTTGRPSMIGQRLRLDSPTSSPEISDDDEYEYVSTSDAGVNADFLGDHERDRSKQYLRNEAEDCALKVLKEQHKKLLSSYGKLQTKNQHLEEASGILPSKMGTLEMEEDFEHPYDKIEEPLKEESVPKLPPKIGKKTDPKPASDEFHHPTLPRESNQGNPAPVVPRKTPTLPLRFDYSQSQEAQWTPRNTTAGLLARITDNTLPPMRMIPVSTSPETQHAASDINSYGRPIKVPLLKSRPKPAVPARSISLPKDESGGNDEEPPRAFDRPVFDQASSRQPPDTLIPKCPKRLPIPPPRNLSPS